MDHNIYIPLTKLPCRVWLISWLWWWLWWWWWWCVVEEESLDKLLTPPNLLLSSSTNSTTFSITTHDCILGWAAGLSIILILIFPPFPTDLRINSSGRLVPLILRCFFVLVSVGVIVRLSLGTVTVWTVGSFRRSSPSAEMISTLSSGRLMWSCWTVSKCVFLCAWERKIIIVYHWR